MNLFFSHRCITSLLFRNNLFMMMIFLSLLLFVQSAQKNDDDKYLTEYFDTKMNYNISFDQISIPGEIISETYNSIKIKVLNQHDKFIIPMIERQIYYVFETLNPNELYRFQIY